MLSFSIVKLQYLTSSKQAAATIPLGLSSFSPQLLIDFDHLDLNLRVDSSDRSVVLHYMLSMTSVPVNLAALPAHSIFESGKKKQDDWELVDAPTDGLVGTKTSRMVIRDKDLIVASGSEIRMCSLAGQSWTVEEGHVGTYQVSCWSLFRIDEALT